MPRPITIAAIAATVRLALALATSLLFYAARPFDPHGESAVAADGAASADGATELRPIQGTELRPIQGTELWPIQGTELRPIQGTELRPIDNGEGQVKRTRYAAVKAVDGTTVAESAAMVGTEVADGMRGTEADSMAIAEAAEAVGGVATDTAVALEYRRWQALRWMVVYWISGVATSHQTKTLKIPRARLHARRTVFRMDGVAGSVGNGWGGPGL